MPSVLMNAVNLDQMRELERVALAAGFSEATLIEAAGAGLAREVFGLFGPNCHLCLYLGSGHNAADALVAARHLIAAGWSHEVHWAVEVACCRPAVQLAWRRLQDAVRQHQLPPVITQRRRIALDALVGVGCRGDLRPAHAALVREMNQARRHGDVTVAVDVPSGSCELGWDCTKLMAEADATVCLGAVKAYLLEESAGQWVGRLSVVNLPGMPRCGMDLLCRESLAGSLAARPWGSYKGTVGHVGVVAGSPGMVGAAQLACLGALRAGAGLVSLFCDPRCASVAMARMPAEVMVRSWADGLPPEGLNAWLLGPGLTRQHFPMLLDFLRSSPSPAVVDAGALQGDGLDWVRVLRAMSAPRVLTPHAGEWRRIAGPVLGPAGSRAEIGQRWVRLGGNHVLVLKGARSMVADARLGVSWNGSGHSGMATGGMGDVLGGVIAGLLAQGIEPGLAARLGVWSCGRAGEVAALRVGFHSLLPTDLALSLGPAFEELRPSGLPFGLPEAQS